MILCFQLLGEGLARGLMLPVPGPVVGMLLLFATLLVRGAAPAEVQMVAQGFVQHLALLFVPAGVGVMVYLGCLQGEWLPLALTLVGSTTLTIVATAWTMRLLARFRVAPQRPKEVDCRL
jgi:holin-like protein